MRTIIECIPCLIRQAIGIAEMISDNTAAHSRIIPDILHCASVSDLKLSPPALAQILHRSLKESTGLKDPLEAFKKQQNELAIQFIPEYRDRVLSASDPLITAARFAISANGIVPGKHDTFSSKGIKKTVERTMTEAFYGERDAFRKSVENAHSILYLTDNAGEIAFDRLLVELISPSKVTMAVRGAPVFNDATISDAAAVGLDEIVDIIDNGSDAPGTLLEDCSSEFIRRYRDADLVISKGQGNYQSLKGEEKEIFFLFNVRCTVTATQSGAPLGAHLLLKNRRHFNHPAISGVDTKGIGDSRIDTAVLELETSNLPVPEF
jgi:uncharacterized protein with ATP-grasp and redox domains